MFKIIRRILAFLVILTIAVIAISSVFILTLDPNEHKTEITNTISDAIEYPVHIRGEIDFKLFPILHLSVNDILVESPAGFNASLLEVDKTTASVNPLPLLKGELDIGEITLKQPRLNLLTKPDGKTNWENLLRPKKTDKPAALALFINRLSIEDANIVWEDLKNNDSLRVEELSLETDSFISGEPVNIALSAVANDDNSGGGIEFSSQAKIHLDIERKIIDAQNINVEASVWKDNKMQPLSIKLFGNGNYNSEQDLITLQDVSLAGGGLQAKADIKILSVSENAIVNFNVRDSTLNMRELPDFMRIEDPRLPDQITITTAGTLNSARKQIKLDTLNMNAEDISISGDGQLSILTETPKIDADLTVKMGTLDLSKQTENTIPKATVGKTGKNAAATDLAIAPLAALLGEYQLSMETNLTIGQLKLENLTLNNLNTAVQIQGRKITMLLSETTLFNGSFSGFFAGQIPTAGNPSWQMNGKIKQFDVEEMLAVLSEEKKPTFRGQATIDYQLTASGISDTAIKRSLDGNVHIAISNGRLFNPKLESVLIQAITFLDKDAVETKTELLHVDDLRTDAIFANGVVKNNDFQMQTPLLNIAGAGKTNLITSALDYRLMLELNRHNKKNTIKIPLLVSGTIEKPKYALDLPQLIKQEAEKQIQKEIKKQLDKVGETLNEELGKTLKKLKLPF